MVPEWDERGLIPPVVGRGASNSPYEISPTQIVERFGKSKKRRHLLDGLLEFRADLYACGISLGFQWINGSFVEDVEQRRDRGPRDIDVVTFYSAENGGLLPPPPYLEGEDAKDRYGIDSFFVDMSDPAESIVEITTYWNSLWSHSRGNHEWKGYLQMGLSSQEDQIAIRTLAGMRAKRQK